MPRARRDDFMVLDRVLLQGFGSSWAEGKIESMEEVQGRVFYNVRLSTGGQQRATAKQIRFKRWRPRYDEKHPDPWIDQRRHKMEAQL